MYCQWQRTDVHLFEQLLQSVIQDRLRHRDSEPDTDGRLPAGVDYTRSTEADLKNLSASRTLLARRYYYVPQGHGAVNDGVLFFSSTYPLSFELSLPRRYKSLIGPVKTKNKHHLVSRKRVRNAEE
ncbi:hypothetical protein RvY_13913-2 [Ramazzottius varieornatus]|uniref:Uncharacterized protein n=1 Tax=Ramazzottius varieornatus TaxID=947166 RepID=A0A1D1VRA7_RAMVA|nr:hypothetical protein RvY_13913-2 [Ramazzottius varieornatus]